MKPMLNFSILDNKERATTPTDTPKETKQYKTTHPIQNPLQSTLEALDGIQAAKIEISQGIKSGCDVYPLLLKAVQLIAILTGERDFYTVHRDVMQGMGALEQIPAEWERDNVNTSLLKLESNRRNIENAIANHKQWLDGQPIGEYENTESGYDRRIKKCFGVAYKFLDKHKHARTDEDWIKIAEATNLYVDQLIVDLIIACVNELERECNSKS